MQPTNLPELQFSPHNQGHFRLWAFFRDEVDVHTRATQRTPPNASPSLILNYCRLDFVVAVEGGRWLLLFPGQDVEIK